MVFLPSASLDLAEGYYFYESQEAGIIRYFLEILSDQIDQLSLLAVVHLKVGDYHKMLVSCFPYFIYYSIENESILVRAVVDGRRDPRWIAEKLKGI